MSADILSDCWLGPYHSLETCCLQRISEPAHWQEFLSGARDLDGNAKCWDHDFTFLRCCTYNSYFAQIRSSASLAVNWFEALPILVWYVAIRPTGSVRYLKLINGWTLQVYFNSSTPWALPIVDALGGVPKRGWPHTFGEGLLWHGGYTSALWVAQFDFGFPATPHRTFLEVAAGVGAPSLAALARGFRVWSSDVRPGSAWQRTLGASATFGAHSLEARRLRTPILDLFNTSTWPRRRFDVIYLSGSFEPQPKPTSDSWNHKFCAGFRQLIKSCLNIDGVMLFSVLAILGHGAYYKRCLDFGHQYIVSVHTGSMSFSGVMLNESYTTETDVDIWLPRTPTESVLYSVRLRAWYDKQPLQQQIFPL